MKRVEPEAWEKRLAKLPLKEGGFSRELIQKVRERVEQERPPVSRNRWLRWSPAVALALVMAAGLTQTERWTEELAKLSKTREPVALEAMDRNQEHTLKVAFFQKDTFMSNYGKTFMERYPHIEVQVVQPRNQPAWSSQGSESFEQWLEKERPDVLALSMADYKRLAEQGLLYDLNGVIKQDRFDLDGFHPGVIDMLREQGNGKLYGLAPEFEQLALYYNKELFDKYGIAYPKDGMSWEDLLQLAARFAAEGTGTKRVYGLAAGFYSEQFGLVQYAAKSKGLRFVDPSGRQVTVDTPEWRKLFEQALDAFRQGYVYQPEPLQPGAYTTEERLKSDLFLNGQAAMTLQGFEYMNSLEEARQRNPLSSFPWDVAKEPTDPSHPDRSSSLAVHTVFAVNAKSEHLRSAWEMVKFIHSKEAARSMASTSPDFLSTRLLGKELYKGKPVDVFYSLRPLSSPLSMETAPPAFQESFYQLAVQQTKAVLGGRITLDEALKQLQEAGQRALIQAGE
ncbi:ABC transporter substrate-binding protein [Paenibacillus naphthalenovorans]|uniref:ABC transporter substrate-binding protein n=1 Tax=Paenibacillus naphthalenovorans TaxID=162209 RepID=UPI003D29ACB0